MKIRTGFVSNSSSSSFVCDVCGRNESGYAISLRDCEMMKCKLGHTFCNSEAVVQFDNLSDDNLEKIRAELIEDERGCTWKNDESKQKEIERLTAMSADGLRDEIEEDCYEVPSCMCPICCMTEARESDMLDFMLRKAGQSRRNVLQDMQGQFDCDYSKFREFVGRK